MYSRARGKAGSKTFINKTVPSWLTHPAKEIEMLVIKLSKEGKSPSKIGLHLRDAYGIPDVKMVTKKRITQILNSAKLLGELPEDLSSLIKRSVTLRKHLEKNHHDNTALRGLQLTDSKINRLIKYYKRSKRLSAEWKYQSEKAAMMVE